MSRPVCPYSATFKLFCNGSRNSKFAVEPNSSLAPEIFALQVRKAGSDCGMTKSEILVLAGLLGTGQDNLWNRHGDYPP